MRFSKDLLRIDASAEAETIVSRIRQNVAQKLKKRGAVVGVSGGVDSAVTLALCVRALGANKVLAVLMPEQDSGPDSLTLAQKLAHEQQVEYVVEDMTAALTGFAAYQRRDEAIRRILPEYQSGYKAKIGLPGNILEQDVLNVFQLTTIAPDGEKKAVRLPIQAYLQIVAASNFKQRSRMCMLYYHAESRNYAVIGTANKNEHDLGFFVKYGDGGADAMPIAHLFKSQVFQLAQFLELPVEIINRAPTTDTYSAEQTQEEFFYRLPFEILDTIWFGWEQQYPTDDIARTVNLNSSQVQNVINDLKRKMAATEYLRTQPLF